MLEQEASFAELSWSDRVAYLFNRTMLGLGILVGCWHLWAQNWLQVVAIFGVMVPVYFWLWNHFDAP